MNWSGKKENFSKLTRKGDKWTIQILERKGPQSLGLSKQLCLALTSSIESCDKHLKPPPPPEKKMMKYAKWTTETRQGYSQKVTLYFVTHFFPSVFKIPLPDFKP